MQFSMKQSLRKTLCFGTVAAVLFGCFIGLLGCNNKTPTQVNDILTQKETESGKTNITVLVKYAFTINSFEKAVEEKFPDINIIQVGNYTRDMGIEEYASRLEHDNLTDIVMTWPLEVGEEYWSDRLLDLSGMDFTNRYNLSMLNTISNEGELYYLPGPAQVRGIIYNKTLFKENNWQVPSNYDEFASLCQDIESTGIRSLQLGLSNGEVLNTAFVGYNYGKYYNEPKDIAWLDQYNDGTGSFGDHFSTALDTFQRLIDDKILQKNDLDVDYAKREQMLYSRECAMVEDSVLLAKMGSELSEYNDEFAMMPFFNPDGEDWSRLYMVCYIGLNKHLAEPENKSKYDLVMKLMEYISTSEGQQDMMADTGAMYSSLTNVGAPQVPEIEALQSSLNKGNYAIFPELKNSQPALEDALKGMLLGELTKEEVIQKVDEQNIAPSQKTPPEVFGKATENFSILETGNFVTDAMKKASACEIALFLDNGKDGLYNGKGISASLHQGEVTSTDVVRIFPDLKFGETGNLWKIKMTGENLINTLEQSIKVDNNSNWFYYFSGLRMQYDPVAEPGSRIKKITTDDGKEIDLKKVYSIAVMDKSVPEEYIISHQDTGTLITTIIGDEVLQQKTISPSKDNRFIVAQS